jgi:enamine deaminase RidA (YjgF/YER057c/UK114 family)
VTDRVPAGTQWGDRFGYSRAVRRENVIEVAGTVGAGASAYEQARAALATIVAALEELGAGVDDVVRTRMFVVDIEQNADEVGRAHGEVFGEVKPATAMYGISALIDRQYVVEIEATALKPFCEG